MGLVASITVLLLKFSISASLIAFSVTEPPVASTRSSPNFAVSENVPVSAPSFSFFHLTTSFFAVFLVPSITLWPSLINAEASTRPTFPLPIIPICMINYLGYKLILIINKCECFCKILKFGFFKRRILFPIILHHNTTLYRMPHFSIIFCYFFRQACLHHAIECLFIGKYYPWKIGFANVSAQNFGNFICSPFITGNITH